MKGGVESFGTSVDKWHTGCRIRTSFLTIGANHAPNAIKQIKANIQNITGLQVN